MMHPMAQTEPPTPSAEPGSASWWDQRYAGDDLLWSLEPNRFVVDECADLPPGRALDVACGEGRNAIWLAKVGWQVTAVDFSGAALDKARALADRARVQVSWVAADVVSWLPAAAEQAFDLVVLAYLQVPSAQRRLLLTAAAATVTPGGSLLVVGHDRSNLDHGTGGPQDPALLWSVHEVELPGHSAVRAEVAARPVQDATAYDTVVRLVRTP